MADGVRAGVEILYGSSVDPPVKGGLVLRTGCGGRGLRPSGVFGVSYFRGTEGGAVFFLFDVVFDVSLRLTDDPSHLSGFPLLVTGFVKVGVSRPCTLNVL